MINKYIFLLFTSVAAIISTPFELYSQEKPDTTRADEQLSVEYDDLAMFGVSIAPNPAKDFVTITLDPDLFRGNINVTISNVKNEEVFKKKYQAKKLKNNKIRINVEDFKSGIYKVVIETLEVALDLHFIKH